MAQAFERKLMLLQVHTHERVYYESTKSFQMAAQSVTCSPFQSLLNLINDSGSSMAWILNLRGLQDVAVCISCLGQQEGGH